MDGRGQSSGSQLEVTLSPGNSRQCLQIFFVVTTIESTFLSSEQKPGMFSNIPQHTGQLPTTKNYLIPNVNSPRLRETGTKRESYLKSSYYNIIGKDPMVTLDDQLYLGDCQNLQCKLPLRIQIECQGLNSVTFGKMQTLG